MKLIYRAAAVEDVEQTFNYIRDKLNNPSAAESFRRRVVQAVSLLKENPYMGTPLGGRYDGLETNIRFLIVSRHLIFYEVHDNMIELIRILDGRTDYLTYLFE